MKFQNDFKMISICQIKMPQNATKCHKMSKCQDAKSRCQDVVIKMSKCQNVKMPNQNTKLLSKCQIRMSNQNVKSNSVNSNCVIVFDLFAVVYFHSNIPRLQNTL